MKLTYRDKIILIGAVVIIIWAIGIFLIIKPAFTTMGDTSKTKDSKDNEVITLQERVEQEKNLKEDLQKAYDLAVEHSNEFFYKVDTKEGVTDTIRDLLYTKQREIVNSSFTISDMSANTVSPYASKDKAEVESYLDQQARLIENTTQADATAQVPTASNVAITISTYAVTTDYTCTIEELLDFADSLQSTDQQSFIIQSASIEDVSETGDIEGNLTFNYYMAPEIPKPAALGGNDKDDAKDEAKDDESKAD